MRIQIDIISELNGILYDGFLKLLQNKEVFTETRCVLFIILAIIILFGIGLPLSKRLKNNVKYTIKMSTIIPIQ